MSEKRKVLTAKRLTERKQPAPNRPFSQSANNRNKGVKRGFSETPTKNLANDRLKRLRMSLNEEVQKQNVNRKRPPESSDVVAVEKKVPKTVSNLEFKVVPDRDEEAMEWCSSANSAATCGTSNDATRPSPANCDLYIVVDTNIFLSNLETIKRIIDGSHTAKIYIPWIVIEELDFIKDDSQKTALRHKAQESIKYINKMLTQKHGKLLGQSLDDVNAQKHIGNSQDNKILAACLQLIDQQKNVILLSNDVNLRNKAHFNHITVCSDAQIESKLRPVSKADRIRAEMTELCRCVINECARNAYGVAATRMPIGQANLSTLDQCIRVFCKYWFPVFKELLMKQFKKAIDDLDTFLNCNLSILDRSPELKELVRLCVRVCIFLKDVECCRSTIEGTIRNLNHIRDS